VFQIRCHGGGSVQTFRLAPRSYDDIYCTNGADAEMRVYTDRDNGDSVVVHGTVFDGNTYRLFYDSDGDVSFRSIG